MPGISAIDCLFADLKIDPASMGLQSYDATEFLLYDENFSTTSHLVLWQIAIIGEIGVVNNNGSFCTVIIDIQYPIQQVIVDRFPMIQ